VKERTGCKISSLSHRDFRMWITVDTYP